jgi:hypothetical protein
MAGFDLVTDPKLNECESAIKASYPSDASVAYLK